jgi:hypothetical protein
MRDAIENLCLLFTPILHPFSTCHCERTSEHTEDSMRKIVMVGFVISSFWCGSILAQNATPAPAAPAGQSQTTSANGPMKIAPGSVIPVELTKSIDAKKARPGDEVEAKVTQDLKTPTGAVLVPKDTKVVGRITEAEARSKEQKESELAISFDRAVTKQGSTMQLPMSIQAVIGQRNTFASAPGGDDVGSTATQGAPAGTASPRAPGMGAQPPATPSPAAESTPNDSQNSKNTYPPITSQTQGVIGISNVTLSPAAAGNKGSVLTSDKNNVKLESGTMMLLRVNQ